MGGDEGEGESEFLEADSTSSGPLGSRMSAQALDRFVTSFESNALQETALCEVRVYI